MGEWGVVLESGMGGDQDSQSASCMSLPTELLPIAGTCREWLMVLSWDPSPALSMPCNPGSVCNPAHLSRSQIQLCACPRPHHICPAEGTPHAGVPAGLSGDPGHCVWWCVWADRPRLDRISCKPLPLPDLATPSIGLGNHSSVPTVVPRQHCAFTLACNSSPKLLRGPLDQMIAHSCCRITGCTGYQTSRLVFYTWLLWIGKLICKGVLILEKSLHDFFVYCVLSIAIQNSMSSTFSVINM